MKKALNPLEKRIRLCFIYGSIASGKESIRSDLELFVVADLGLRDIASILSEASKEIGREINPTVYPEQEFKRKLKDGNPFIKEVLEEPKIWLIGEEDELAEMDG